MKNPHAVALGRLGGAKGGPARAKSLTPRRRSEIAKHAGVARARALSAAERSELAQRAAAARWSRHVVIVTVAEAPASVRRLLARYEPAQLRWARAEHRYVVVREILLRGGDRTVHWLRSVLPAQKLRQLIQRFAGAGCNELQRQKLRRALHLSVKDIPVAATPHAADIDARV
jgi:hypothetical protein